MMNSNGLFVYNARAIKMPSLAPAINFSGAAEIGDRPIVDHTGFTGCFDIKALAWAPLNANTANAPDAPPLIEALQDNLGLKLVRAKTGSRPCHRLHRPPLAQLIARALRH